MIAYIVAVVVLAPMCGSELNVAAFVHPTLQRQPLEVHIPMRAALARLFGRVMPKTRTCRTQRSVRVPLSIAG
jgi:hypothetical protein